VNVQCIFGRIGTTDAKKDLDPAATPTLLKGTVESLIERREETLAKRATSIAVSVPIKVRVPKVEPAVVEAKSRRLARRTCGRGGWRGNARSATNACHAPEVVAA
jgi:hypothetical protein